MGNFSLVFNCTWEDRRQGPFCAHVEMNLWSLTNFSMKDTLGFIPQQGWATQLLFSGHQHLPFKFSLCGVPGMILPDLWQIPPPLPLTILEEWQVPLWGLLDAQHLWRTRACKEQDASPTCPMILCMISPISTSPSDRLLFFLDFPVLLALGGWSSAWPALEMQLPLGWSTASV